MKGHQGGRQNVVGGEVCQAWAMATKPELLKYPVRLWD